MIRFIEISVLLSVDDYVNLQKIDMNSLRNFSTIRLSRNKEIYICKTHKLDIDFNLYTNMYSLNDLIYNYLLEFNKISEISHLFKNWSSLYIIYDNDSNEYELINLDNKTIKKLAELGLAIQTHINNFE
ncbi:hypothetical protein A9Z63_00375 [Moraxella lacunata]|uniref:Uncharacterized protein n=2 Tax=Moraxella lacunata TaxID=477 RepID=A0A1B8Q658_MORLA|nr:hypothetical protein A9Z63_00375 [Moraxella lacunata]OBX65174.1 hypothetical protein A9309_03775 [Moraxella lacunata]